MVQAFRYVRVRDEDGNRELSLPDLVILALYHEQHYLVPDSYIENYIGHYKQKSRVHSEQ